MPRRPRDKLPDDVEDALVAMGLKDRFLARPPKARDALLAPIARVRGPDARAARIARMLDELESDAPRPAKRGGAKRWRKGRGKLGALDPLLGAWVAEADSPAGPVRVTRTLERDLGGHYVRLRAVWSFKGREAYEELALIGRGEDGALAFWSFTSDGKRSEGRLADVTDVHPEAVGFEAEMDAGLARMAYWPDDEGDGFRWAVDARTKKGWSRLVEHRYRRA